MSEYQYYEFRTVERPLAQKEMDELRKLSTRAEITPTSFTNDYAFGDFKGSPEAMMARYFDAFVHVANWGTHRLMFRIPRRFVDVEAIKAYCDGEVLSLKAHKEHVVIEFRSEGEPEGWVEGEIWMPSLISIRAELIRGDYRALYLGWLASLRSGVRDEEGDGKRVEPPVPPGLAKLSAALRALAEFLRVDDELIEVAASGNVGEPPKEPSREEVARWLKRLHVLDKDDYLLRVVAEEGAASVRAELLNRFRDDTTPKGARPSPGNGRRTAAQLLEAYGGLIARKDRLAAEREARERAKREREQAEARAKHLDDLGRREEAAWRQVDAMIATKKPQEYDRAVQLLVDLRDLAARSGRADKAAGRVDDLRRRHANKPSLLKRLDEKQLK